MKTEFVTRLVNNPTDRRKFIKRMGATGIGVAAATMLGGSLGKLEAATTITDADILNFALNLEYLEAEFYSMATYGATLLQLGILTASEESGPTTGGELVDFRGSPVAYLATALRVDEQTHVLYLRKALGSAAVKKPTINLDALGYGFESVNDFLKLARQFEDVGVSAYLGAAPLIKSKKYLGAAAAIMATEAQHSGSVRVECIMDGVDSPAVDSLDVPPTSKSPYDVDKNALSIPRTTSQVLNIVYAGGKCSGGFYPDGMNGTIVCQ
ncbi:MAG TPA: ferritin-like domain-containing protein [Terriglobales bacterium]|nr:ferritin-like domain-containing protein [Terriglobales bacterium]